MLVINTGVVQAPELNLDAFDGMDFGEIEAQLYGHPRRQPEHNGALCVVE